MSALQAKHNGAQPPFEQIVYVPQFLVLGTFVLGQLSINNPIEGIYFVGKR